MEPVMERAVEPVQPVVEPTPVQASRLAGQMGRGCRQDEQDLQDQQNQQNWVEQAAPARRQARVTEQKVIFF